MEFTIFKSFPELRYGLSKKKDGFMNVKISADPERHSIAAGNRKRFLDRRGVHSRVFTPYLVHGNEVAVISDKNWQEMIRADGFVTALPDLYLTITVADCFQIYLYDPVHQVVGLAHAGWRGVVKNIVKNMISVFRESFQSNPQEIFCALGPGIQKCHFVVRDDVINEFREFSQFVEVNSDSYTIDLPGIISYQAKKEGVSNIEISPQCTYCLADTYFSYRRDKPKIYEVMLAYIGTEREKSNYGLSSHR